MGDPERQTEIAAAASRNGKKNIVNVTAFGRTPEGLVYFVMEELQGRSLAQLLRAEGSAEQQEIATQLRYLAPPVLPPLVEPAPPPSGGVLCVFSVLMGTGCSQGEVD